jgi:hypothetical protein
MTTNFFSPLSFVAVFGSRMGKNQDPGSRINIPDPQHCKFATDFASVVDTGGKFATGVNDSGGKFAACVNDIGGNLPPVVSTTPAANLPPQSMTPVAYMGTISGY